MHDVGVVKLRRTVFGVLLSGPLGETAMIVLVVVALTAVAESSIGLAAVATAILGGQVVRASAAGTTIDGGQLVRRAAMTSPLRTPIADIETVVVCWSPARNWFAPRHRLLIETSAGRSIVKTGDFSGHRRLAEWAAAISDHHHFRGSVSVLPARTKCHS